MTKKEIGRILRDARLRKGFTRAEVAVQFGKTDKTVGHWETGFASPDASILLALCDMYDISIVDSFDANNSTFGFLPNEANFHCPLGDRIKKARIDKGYTQEQLAKILGIAKSTLAGYETGSRGITADKIKSITEALDVSSDYLLDINHKTLEPSARDMKFYKMYNALDEHGKFIVDSVLQIEFDRCKAALVDNTTS